ncbi:hypothetical protein [Paraburkholderia saeva]|uniref:Uncharacterized protein n=1 Tax=Paraburkholderia saeva TaxID=2777537 RepID=A0A9N8RZK4_9BURK|nr:hypothetical protein [Paraburkholderia saeva]CAG4912458.1 hypothetical protein LMG31841_04171 [Paraburkholderia saeva]
MSLVPAFDFVGPFNWFFSAAAGAMPYTALVRKSRRMQSAAQFTASQLSE